MATLYLSGGGLGRSAHAWPEALRWLAAQPGALLLASIASDDDVQARTLQQLLSAAGRDATLVPHLPHEVDEVDPETERFRELHQRLHDAALSVLQASEGEIRYLE